MGIEYLDFEVEDNELHDEAIERFSVRGMKVGENGWTVPWAVDIDTLGRLWLKPLFFVQPTPDNLVSMYLERREDGFMVDLSHIDSSDKGDYYLISADIVESMPPENPHWLPVIELIA